MKRFWGEDRAFSRRLNEMGERWWIYASITFAHWGMNRWEGNFGKELADMKRGNVVIGDTLPAQAAAGTQVLQ